MPEPPGARLSCKGLTAFHPVVLLPGIVTGGLGLWEGKPCADGLFRKRLWGGSFTEIFKRPLCWLEQLTLDNETGLDPPGIRVRALPGLVAADYFAPGYFVWAVLIENLVQIGYEGKNMYMASYDGDSLSRIQRYVAPGLLDFHILGLQTLQHVMRVSSTWDSIISLMPKGGDNIWGNLDWSLDEGHDCNSAKKRYFKPSTRENNSNHGDKKMGFQVEEATRYGRIVSFDKAASELPSSQLSALGSKEFMPTSPSINSGASRGKIWTEYDEISRDNVWKLAENKAYTARSLLDLLRSVAPKMMKRAQTHFSHGIAENLDDQKYDHYKYWSNPLETK